MMRDAMPSKEEAEADHRGYLRRHGCETCDETDPDRLKQVGVLLPSCPMTQTPRDPFIILCDECRKTRETLRERSIRRARNRDGTTAYRETKTVGVVFHECGSWRYVEAEPMDDVYAEGFYEDAHPDWVPTGPLRCRCGASVDEYVHLADIDDAAGGDPDTDTDTEIDAVSDTDDAGGDDIE